ncbi:ubiquitin thioesterase OTU1-like [Teleopsis dalmanni]|uniref:ubiquitin thioesterase OTU1-like n=1 Tax=Teleopsis dalmanni TaxID=139649 RepID=UPI0018CDFC17|nr:ubiquitin thioesterase OTU1-like [Teleopsis dalmanni]
MPQCKVKLKSKLLNITIKTTNGDYNLERLHSDTAIFYFKSRVSAITKIPKSDVDILRVKGQSFIPLNTSEGTKSITSIGIMDGDVLYVQDKQELTEDMNDDSLHSIHENISNDDNDLESDTLSVEHSIHSIENSSNEVLSQKVVPADNSCLFWSIRFVLMGRLDYDGNQIMRRMVAQEIAADPIQYNSAILGIPNKTYCKWIQQPCTWGGSIEVSIISKLYGIEIDVVDTRNGIIIRFGEDKAFQCRGFIIYDGFHYNALYMKKNNDTIPKTIFPIDEMNVFQQALEIAKEQKSKYTLSDNKFKTYCVECDAIFLGSAQIEEHAEQFGHYKFDKI